MAPPRAVRTTPEHHYLPTALAALVLAVSIAVFAASGATPTAAALHAVLAAGLFPLILAAMIYFTPVLTRRRAARPLVRLLPLAALAAGLLAVRGLSGEAVWIHAGAGLGFVTAATLLVWMSRQASHAIGGAHPGLAWYRAALALLLLGLAAILTALAFPEHWITLRRVHLHLNLLGFVGLTAFGTLQVLLPTAGDYADPQANLRLRQDLKYAVAGTLTVAAAAAWWAPAAWPGALLWLVPLARLARSAWRHRRRIARWHAGSAALATAVGGWALTLVAGALHTAGIAMPRAAFALFFGGFLFPLVSGAATHLLPLWLKPQADGASQARLRGRLAWGSGVRAAVFFTAGVLLLLGIEWAIYLAVAALAMFVVQLAGFLLRLNEQPRPRVRLRRGVGKS